MAYLLLVIHIYIILVVIVVGAVDIVDNP